MYINITDSETGNNKASSAALVTYLEKENRLPEKELQPEHWFNGKENIITPQQVRVTIDNNIAKLGRNDAKFYLINISPSQKEIGYLKERFGEQGAAEQLKAFALKVMDGYAANFKRPGIEDNTNLMWYGKLENFRYYGHNDPEVKQGQRQRGERKDGEQMHIQIIVSRKDITNTVKLSPMNNSRGKNAQHSAKLGQFDRKVFKQSGETLFDQMFSFDRALKDTMKYAITMKSGNAQEKQQLYAREQRELSPDNEFTSHKEPSLFELLNPGSLLPDAGRVQYNNPDDLVPDPKKKKRGYRR
jgi:protein-tyrosine-phosphatase